MRAAEEGVKRERTSVPMVSGADLVSSRTGTDWGTRSNRSGAFSEKAMTWKDESSMARVQPKGWMWPPRWMRER